MTMLTVRSLPATVINKAIKKLLIVESPPSGTFFSFSCLALVCLVRVEKWQIIILGLDLILAVFYSSLIYYVAS